MLNVVANHTRRLYSAADSFLNRRLPENVRLDVIKPYTFITDKEQLAKFDAIVLSNDETAVIRAAALNKIYRYADENKRFLDQVLVWLGDPQTPKPLRDETLDLIANLSFSSLTGKLEVYDKLLTDPDLRYRGFGAVKLLQGGDARAQQLLISGLENPTSALFEPAQAIELLSLSPKKEFFPAVYKILLETKDKNIRLEALESLGAYTPARAKIIAISRDPNETEIFRESALMALYSGDKENIVSYVLPILTDTSASTRLQVLAVQMGMDVRQPMAYRRSKKAKRADNYDVLLKNISDGNGINKDEALLNIARKYLLLVKPSL